MLYYTCFLHLTSIASIGYYDAMKKAKRKRQKVDPAEVVQLIKSGVSLTQIAQSSGITRERVRQIARANGFSPVHFIYAPENGRRTRRKIILAKSK